MLRTREAPSDKREASATAREFLEETWIFKWARILPAWGCTPSLSDCFSFSALEVVFPLSSFDFLSRKSSKCSISRSEFSRTVAVSTLHERGACWGRCHGEACGERGCNQAILIGSVFGLTGLPERRGGYHLYGGSLRIGGLIGRIFRLPRGGAVYPPQRAYRVPSPRRPLVQSSLVVQCANSLHAWKHEGLVSSYGSEDDLFHRGGPREVSEPDSRPPGGHGAPADLGWRRAGLPMLVRHLLGRPKAQSNPEKGRLTHQRQSRRFPPVRGYERRGLLFSGYHPAVALYCFLV